MKMQSFKIATQKAVTTFMLVAVTFLSVQAASPNGPLPKDSTGKDVSVQCLGLKDNMFLFKVKYNNDKGTRFNVSVRDKEGYVIFQDTYSDKSFDKLFKINQNESGPLTFEIRNLKDNTVNTFAVSTTRRLQEELMISKVN